MTDKIYVKVSELYREVKAMYDDKQEVVEIEINDDDFPIQIDFSAHNKDLFWTEYDSIEGLKGYGDKNDSN